MVAVEQTNPYLTGLILTNCSHNYRCRCFADHLTSLLHKPGSSNAAILSIYDIMTTKTHLWPNTINSPTRLLPGYYTNICVDEWWYEKASLKVWKCCDLKVNTYWSS